MSKCLAARCAAEAVCGPVCERHALETYQALWAQDNNGLTARELRGRLESKWRAQAEVRLPTVSKHEAGEANGSADST